MMCVCAFFYEYTISNNAIADHKDINRRHLLFIIFNTKKGKWVDTVLENIIQYSVKVGTMKDLLQFNRIYLLLFFNWKCEPKEIYKLSTLL